MSIEIINKPDKEFNSITTLVINGVKIPLDERSLVKLIRLLYCKRKDLFDEVDDIVDLKNQVISLENDVSRADEDYNILLSECEELKDLLLINDIDF